MKIKNSAIIYSGYDYQTLQGIKLLIEWLNNPTKYHRMAFEADKDSNNTPTGIDDIVCEQPNGIKDFWQVKFTPSPEKDDNRLSWSWLLNISGKTEKSRSILKKIYDAIVSVPHETLGNVILLTNKLPDRDMEFCISGSKIEFDKIDKANKDNIINQLGSDDAARFLLSKLTIQHSDDNYDAINRKIRSELLKFSNDAGAERLITRAREWAIYQDNPPSNGWIYLNHIREILSFRRPEPIPENFFVPEDYCLPNLDFHNNILEKITHSAGEVITLTGKPGGGKSTYLSFLCQELEIRKIPLIRHHYFLSTVDSTIDRLSSRVVAESLLHQVNTYHENAKADTNQPENLCKALKACAHYYSTQGKPFVVLIDGLDHVWRDNTQDKRPLDEIFKQILPVMDNLVVLIGTQLVDDNLLPHTLLTYSQKKDWLSLPGMSGDSIYEYLQYQVESKRLHLNFDENHINSEIQNSARALLKITNGYPLHVIYSCEYLSNQGLPLSDWQIKQLPPCTSGNIVNYYNELWRTLNYRQKDVLHLSCGFQFAWPRQAIGKIIKDEHETAPSVNSVAHLLSENISGVSPFHESLIVFIKSLNDHQSRINSLLPAVCEWLQLEAPSHLKDSWLWSCQALMGNSTSLRQGVKRDWILDQLVSGMPVKNYIRLLSEAETYAFNECNYAETYRHRALKNRLINGPGSQVWDGDLTKLEILSTINADIHGLNEILSRENEYSSIKLSILSIVLYFRGETERAKRLSKKAIDHYRTKIKLILSEFSQNQEIESVTLIKASTLTDTLNYDEVFNENNFADWPDNYITSFRLACLIKKELNLLMRAHQNLPSGSHHANDIEFDAIRLSILEDADIEYWPEYKNFLYQSLSKLSKAHSKKVLSDIRSEFCCPTIHRVYNVGSSQNYHFWFFSALQTRITAEGNFTWIPIKAEYNKVDISDHYDLLNELADAIGGGVAVGYQFTFDQVCSMFPVDLMIDGMEWDRDKATTTLKKEWIKIAADCHLLTTKKKISSSELKNVLEDGIFHSSWLRSWYLDLGLELLSEDAVLLLIDSEVLHQEKEIEETIYKSTTYLELAEIALRHSQIVQSKQCLTKAWDFVLGYGHRRDTTIFDILDAIDAISKIDSDSALQLLERISPIVFNICDFTDGKETRHSKQLIHSLIAKLNLQTAVSIYNQQVSDGEWYYADETINSLIRQCCLSSPIIKLLYLTGLPSSCYKYLNEQLELRNEDATEIAFNIKALLDLDIRDYSIEISESNNVGEEIILNPADYPPNSFEQLIIYLTGKSHRKKLYKIWYIYWCKQGKELELLQQLIPLTSNIPNHFDDIKYLLDLLYQSQRKIAGKTKAFNLLVTAHNAMNGWSEWYEPYEDSINRLAIIAEQYPKKIDEFIKLTTISFHSLQARFGNLTVPDDKLVYLLSKSGKLDEAIQLTLSMIDALEESVRNLVLIKPNWNWEKNNTIDDILIKLLISRLKLPIPTIKLLVIEQIALLLNNGYPNLEDLLKQDLASRKQESECIEVLCTFYVASTKGYNYPTDLGNYIKARTTLSDLLLNSLNQNINKLGDYAYPFTPNISFTNNHRFNYFQGTHVPFLYQSWLEKIGNKTNIPLTEYYEMEWNNTFEYQPSSKTSIDYFLGTDWQRYTGQFYTQASHRGRSAYLRTIEFAKKNHDMPNSYAEHLSIPALPIEPAYVGLVPKKPTWMPEWNKNTIADTDNIIEFVKLVLDNFSLNTDNQELLSFSLPIKIDENNWIDLSIIKAKTTEESNKNLEIEERSLFHSIGRLLDKELTYESNDIAEKHIKVMASIPFPTNRYGHWYSDIESRGLYVPICNIKDKKIIGKTDNDVFCYYIDQFKIGFSSFWFTNWKPIHPKGIKSLCGSYTIAFKDNIKVWLKETSGEKVFYICNAKIISSEQDYGEFNEQNLCFSLEKD